MRMTTVFTLAPVFIGVEGAWSLKSLTRTSPGDQSHKARVGVQIYKVLLDPPDP
jgi:hypothetical protein